jgi:hypothetical protein
MIVSIDPGTGKQVDKIYTLPANPPKPPFPAADPIICHMQFHSLDLRVIFQAVRRDDRESRYP